MLPQLRKTAFKSNQSLCKTPTKYIALELLVFFERYYTPMFAVLLVFHEALLGLLKLTAP